MVGNSILPRVTAAAANGPVTYTGTVGNVVNSGATPFRTTLLTVANAGQIQGGPSAEFRTALSNAVTSNPSAAITVTINPATRDVTSISVTPRAGAAPLTYTPPANPRREITDLLRMTGR
jgi:hypothetical protein